MRLSGIQASNYSTKIGRSENTSKVNKETSLFNFNSNQSVSNNNAKETDYTIEMTSMIGYAVKIANNVDILCNLNAGGLTSLALKTASQANSVVSSVKLEVSGYAAQISMIMNNPFLSDSEKESRIKMLKNKIEACCEEGNIKVATLFNISEIIKALAPTFISLQKSGVNTQEMTSMLDMLLTNVNSKPSDFSDAESKKDLYDTIDRNEKQLFGKNTTEMLNGFISKTDKEIKEKEEKLKSKDLTEEERKQLKAELIVYKAENRLFKSLAD